MVRIPSAYLLLITMIGVTAGLICSDSAMARRDRDDGRCPGDESLDTSCIGASDCPSRHEGGAGESDQEDVPEEEPNRGASPVDFLAIHLGLAEQVERLARGPMPGKGPNCLVRRLAARQALPAPAPNRRGRQTQPPRNKSTALCFLAPPIQPHAPPVAA